MFAFLKTLAGGANIWFMAALVGVGFAAGGVVTYPVATWKERAAWAAANAEHANAMKEFADSRTADLQASEQARAAEADRFTKAVQDVAEKNKTTQTIVSTVLDNLGGLTNEIHSVRTKLITIPVGNCTFTADADSLRLAAYQASLAASGTGRASEAGKASGSDAKPDSATRPGKSGTAPAKGTGTKGH